MTEPQVWAVIGVTAATFFGMLTLTASMFTRLVKDGFDSIRSEMHLGFEGLRHEMDARFDAVDTRMGALEGKFAHLDRDVHFLMERERDRRDD